jgi:hypothetical protein
MKKQFLIFLLFLLPVFVLAQTDRIESKAAYTGTQLKNGVLGINSTGKITVNGVEISSAAAIQLIQSLTSSTTDAPSSAAVVTAISPKIDSARAKALVALKLDAASVLNDKTSKSTTLPLSAAAAGQLAVDTAQKIVKQTKFSFGVDSTLTALISNGDTTGVKVNTNAVFNAIRARIITLVQSITATTGNTAMVNPLIFNTSYGLAVSNNNWTNTGSIGSGVASKKIAAGQDGYILFDYLTADHQYPPAVFFGFLSDSTTVNMGNNPALYATVTNNDGNNHIAIRFDGTNYTNTSLTIPDNSVIKIAAQRSGSNTIFTASLSTDAGATWTQFDTNTRAYSGDLFTGTTVSNPYGASDILRNPRIFGGTAR